MIRRFRYALSIVRDLSMILCPASASVRAEVVAHRAADLLAEREAVVEVWEGYKFGPDVELPEPTYLSVSDVFDVRGGQPEPTEELLLAAANVADDLRRHTHFNHPRHEYLGTLSRQLRDRATLFAQNR